MSVFHGEGLTSTLLAPLSEGRGAVAPAPHFRRPCLLTYLVIGIEFILVISLW